MRLLYIDIDSLRPDHLGCYGYLRETSPNIDRLAAEGVRLEQCHTSDAPCLPSRTSLIRGQFGIHHGAVNHGGTRAQPFGEGVDRGFRPLWAKRTLPAVLREAGMRTASISSFPDRHGAWHFNAGFHETIDPGHRGHEIADSVTPAALDWLGRNATDDGWLLHVNFWDVHVPPRTPEAYGNPFADDPMPDWLTDEIVRHHWTRPGMRSARDPLTLLGSEPSQQVGPFDSLDAVRKLYDGYDTAVRYVDDQVGRLMDALAAAGVLDETLVIVSADHGECLGELNCYGGHCLADHATTRVPMVLRLPRALREHAGHVDRRLHYSIDATATAVELCGGEVPDDWDGVSFAGALTAPTGGREYLVVSQLAQSAQRSVRFEADGVQYMLIRTWDPACSDLPEILLFDVDSDPHELHDLTTGHPKLVERGLGLLEAWTREQLACSDHGDPLETVLAEGPEMVRGNLPRYLERLRTTARDTQADAIEGTSAKRDRKD